MRTFETGGVELEFEVLGSGEPVVCIHGAFLATTFRPLASVPDLAGRYRFVLYHRRGYAGSSPAVEGPSMARQAADCRALIEHLGIDRVHIVGHSYGGAIALQLALDYPDVVHTLALLEPALMVGESGPAYRASLESGVELYRTEGAAAVVDTMFEARWPGYRRPLREALPGAFDQAVRDAATPFEHELQALLEWSFTDEQARSIDPPTLSVMGEDSQNLVSRFGEVHAWLQATLPNAEGFVLPGTTHFLQVEDPIATGEGLAAFWSRHALGAAITSPTRMDDNER